MDAALDPRLRASEETAKSIPRGAETTTGAPKTNAAAQSTAASPDAHRQGQGQGQLQGAIAPVQANNNIIQHGGKQPTTPYQTQLQTAFSPPPPPGFSPSTQNGQTPGAIGEPNYDHASHTPPSLTAGPQGGTPGGEHDASGVDPKKPRACEACRGLKVRCEPEPSNPDGPCKRCAKAGRGCIVTQPTRKRQKKTDSRVAELEKKIDALTATLSATRAGAPGDLESAPHGQEGYAGSGAYGHDASRRDWSSVNTGPGAHSRNSVSQMPRSHNQSPFTGGSSISFPPPMVLAGQKRKYPESRDGRDERGPPSVSHGPTEGRSHEYSDIIDRGIITMERAGELWERYNTLMVPHLPGVVFPETMTVAEIRKTKPILFLAIMASASSETPNVQRVIVKELMQIFADKVVITGEKSIELVQALNVAVIWYWPPEHFEELKFYQLVHMAAVMAIDIGLGRNKPRWQKQAPSSFRDHPFRKHPPPDPTTIEARRAWLTCYFLTTNTAMALHRPSLLRWTTFMTECVDILESSPEAAPSDKYLCHLVWTHRLAEEIGIQFSMDDPSVFVSIADARTQHALRGYERELEKYSSAIPKELSQHASIKFGVHTLSLYMHELALQTEPTDTFKAPFAAESLRESFVSDAALTPAHINALSACLTAIDGIYETFLSMDTASIRCLPVFNYVRVAYATVVLIRVYFAASSPNSELGKVINKDNMKVEQHLENLLHKFRLTAADDKSRPASKFLVVLVMIRSWFLKQGKMEARKGRPANGIAAEDIASPYSQSETARGGSDKNNTPGTAHSAPTPGRTDYSGTANTPLQLLSEVATNKQATGASNNASGQTQRASSGNNHIPSSNEMWYNPSSHPQQPFMYESSDGPSNNAAASGMPPPNQIIGTPAPWMNFNAEFDFNGLGDGFTQAMDMTLAGLGDQDWNGIHIMANDPLFGQMMGDMPGSNMFQF